MPLVAYFSSLLASNVVFHFLTVAAGWVAYDRSNDPLSIAIIGFLQFVPALGLFPFTGYASDRFEKSHIIAIANFVAFVACIGLAAWAWMALPSLTMLYTCMFIYSVARSFEAPATASMLIEIVPAAVFTKTVARSSSTKQIAKVVGPVCAGYLLTLASHPELVFMMPALCALIGAWSMLGLRKDKVSPRPRSALKQLSQIFEGVSYIRHDKTLLGAISLDLCVGLFGGLMALLPILVKDLLHQDGSVLGWLRSSIALGSLMASLLLSFYTVNKNLGKWLIYSILLLAVNVFVIAFVRDIGVLLLLLFAFGSLDALSVHIRQNLVQLATPAAIRGRVTSASQVSVVISNQLSDVRGGLMVYGFGLTPTLALGGIAILGIACIWPKIFPPLVELDRFPEAYLLNA